VVSHDYVSGQWDKYLGFKPFDVTVTKDTITDVMIKQVEKQLGKKKL
jgi:5'-nucleotidase/2',3'-cyclic-nucleotide 2'-phosphodiesterase/3'-nucleotidase/5'-nucleotidase